MISEVNPQGLAAYFAEAKDYGGGEENAKGYLGCTSQVPPEDHRDGFISATMFEVPRRRCRSGSTIIFIFIFYVSLMLALM